MTHLANAQKQPWVITISAGNNAQAVACRARQEWVKAIIMVPKETPLSKFERTRSNGADIILAG